LAAAKVEDERSWNALKVSRLWLDGKATNEELAAVWAASWAAVRDASQTAGWDAVRDAVWAAGWDAVWAASWAAAWAAGRAAARAAGWDAAWGAWRADERDWQRMRFNEMVEQLFEEGA